MSMVELVIDKPKCPVAVLPTRRGSTPNGRCSVSKTIPLTRGYVATVDDADFERLAAKTWWTARRGRTVYAICADGYMHRIIMEPKPGQWTDHINHDGLDNRRENLRLCTSSQNHQNQRKTRGTSRYKGVSLYRDGKWRAKIKKDGKQHSLGHFVNEDDAAKAYDRAAREMFGEYAHTNFGTEVA